jgi:multidrug efflux pump subunit AcrA (membrane-fusion protein)
MPSFLDGVNTELPEPAAQSDLRPKPPDEAGPPQSKTARNVAISVAMLFVIGGFLAFAIHKKGATLRESQTPVRREAVEPSLRLKGTTEAIQSRGILAPALSGEQTGSLTITKLIATGSRVKRGDVLVEFDRQAQIKDFLDKQAEYNKIVDQVKQEQGKENAARAKDETELHQAESDFKKAELEMQKSEIASRIDAEKAQQKLEETKATLQQLRETFDLKRRAAQAAIRIVEIQRDRTRQTMLHAQENAALMQMHAPIDGVVVLNTIWKEGKMGEVQEGDHVQAGVPFMQVVNPSNMQVRALVNQEDLPALQVGLRATVRLDAYPELVFTSELEQIAPVGRSGDFSSKVRTFAVVFSIQGNDPKLMPDLSAAVDVDTAHGAGVARNLR